MVMITGKVSLTTHSERETQQVGELLGKMLTQAAVVSLTGELGAGKTVFAKGVAQGLEIEKPVRSPTFTLMQTYQGRLKLFHFDFYRLELVDELEELGLEEYLEGQGIALLEWGENFPEVLPLERMEIQINRGWDNSHERNLVFLPNGDYYYQLAEKIVDSVEYDGKGKLWIPMLEN